VHIPQEISAYSSADVLFFNFDRKIKQENSGKYILRKLKKKQLPRGSVVG
jgi:hypothetical protein